MIILTLSFVLTLLGFLNQDHFWFDMFSHFRLQYFVIQCMALVILGVRKQFRWAGVTFTFILINGLCIFPYYWPQNNPKSQFWKYQHSEIRPLNLVMLNVHSENTNRSGVLDYLVKKNPEIIALEEINDRWVSWLRPLLSRYKYYKEVVRDDNFGIGLYSKIPLSDIDVKYFPGAGVPSLVANFSYRDQDITMVFTHPVPPASMAYFLWRNEQLAAIANARRSWHQNLIVFGDLNVTSWSRHFKNLLSQTALQDSRVGFGLQTTWPSFLPNLGIAIDHVLVSDSFWVLEREIGPMVGSDHLPVYFSLGIR